MAERTRRKLSLPAKKLSFLALWTDLSAVKALQRKLTRQETNSDGLGGQTGLEMSAPSFLGAVEKFCIGVSLSWVWPINLNM